MSSSASPKRIPSLDGLRALSIIVVTLSHLYSPMKNMGGPGVDLFFVISGFLITHLLIQEKRATGAISWKGFYIRRASRIFPAYFLFLATTGILGIIGILKIDRASWIEAATYTYSLLPHATTEAITHSWSLCVEEHFYLLWPMTLILLGFRRARFVLFGAVVAAAVCRVLMWRTQFNIDTITPTRIDIIAIGCLTAYVWDSPRLQGVVNWTRGRWIVPLAAAGWAVSKFLLSRSGKFQLIPEHPFEAVCMAVVVLSVIQNRGIIGKVLNWGPIVFIGVLSYSIYLGQFLVFPLHHRPFTAMAAIFLYALLSYRLVEEPVLRWSKRWRPRASPQKLPISADAPIAP